MNIRQSVLAQAVVAVACGAYSLIVAPQLGNYVPTHWGISGKPDAYGSPAFALWFGPAMAIFMLLMTWALPRLSPEKFTIDRFEETYGLMMFLVALMMGAVHVVILSATAGKAVDISRTMMAVLGIFFALLGNSMGKVRQNFYMGVRTPWTLSSERVWEATHRQAATLWFFGGLIEAGLALLGAPFWMTISFFLVLGFWPVVQSYFLYQRLERR